MRVLLGALALAIATPGAAQTAPATDAHSGHAQHSGGGQHSEQQRGQPQPSHPSEHDGRTPDCCDKMQQQGQAMECCDKHRKEAGEPPADHSQHGN